LALEKADKKPSLWLSHVDDIFVTWPHDSCNPLYIILTASDPLSNSLWR